MITLSSGIAAEIVKPSVRFCRMISIAVDTPIYLTDHYKDIVYDSNTYDSSPHITSIGDIKQSGLRKNPRTSIMLSGVDQTYYSLFLSNDYINRVVTIYYAFLDEDDAIIDDPLPVYYGRIVDVDMSDDPLKGEANIDIVIGSPFDDFEKSAGRKTNTESQKEFFPLDKGFEFAAQSADVDVEWGG